MLNICIVIFFRRHQQLANVKNAAALHANVNRYYYYWHYKPVAMLVMFLNSIKYINMDN